MCHANGIMLLYFDKYRRIQSNEARTQQKSHEIRFDSYVNGPNGVYYIYFPLKLIKSTI